MLRKRIIMTVLIFTLCAVVATIIGWYIPVLLCDIWQLPWGICR